MKYFELAPFELRLTAATITDAVRASQASDEPIQPAEEQDTQTEENGK
jgi:hypothetical protein